MNTKTISFITGNQNKVIELQNIINNKIDNLIIKSCKIDLPELQGDPEYIASEKCKLASCKIDGPVLIEDTSLCFNALEGLPGPYIKCFLDKIGLIGLNKLLFPYEDKSAYSQTIFAYTKGKGEQIHLFVGRLNGQIVLPRGNLGFGWDPIFQPCDQCTNNHNNNHNHQHQTFGEMEESKKNSISHRYIALQKFIEYCKRNKNI